MRQVNRSGLAHPRRPPSLTCAFRAFCSHAVLTARAEGLHPRVRCGLPQALASGFSVDKRLGNPAKTLPPAQTPVFHS